MLNPDVLLPLHCVMLIVNGCWNRTTLQSVPTRIQETALCGRKALMIVNGLLTRSFIKEGNLPSD